MGGSCHFLPWDDASFAERRGFAGGRGRDLVEGGDAPVEVAASLVESNAPSTAESRSHGGSPDFFPSGARVLVEVCPVFDEVGLATAGRTRLLDELARLLDDVIRLLDEGARLLDEVARAPVEVARAPGEVSLAPSRRARVVDGGARVLVEAGFPGTLKQSSFPVGA